MSNAPCTHDERLYHPLNVLKKVAEDIWIVDGPAVVMRLGFFNVDFPTRLTVVRLRNGDLWCHSPIKLTDDLRTQLNQLGQVAHLVSPNKLHYLAMQEWQEVWPRAMAWACPGVRQRAQKNGCKIRFDADLPLESAPLHWSAEVDQLLFSGSNRLEEVVFFHKKSATLILTDLIENFEQERLRRNKFLARVAGVTDPDGKTPLDLRLTFFGSRDKARSSLHRMLAWQPTRVIVAHGRWYEKSGTAELKRAFRWLE